MADAGKSNYDFSVNEPVNEPVESHIISPTETVTPVDSAMGSNYDFSVNPEPVEGPVPVVREPNIHGTYQIGMQLTAPRRMLEDDDKFRGILRDVVIADMEPGLLALATKLDMPAENIEPYWLELQAAAKSTPDPVEFRNKHVELYNMVLRNPYAADMVTRRKSVTAVSTFLQDILSPGLSMKKAGLAIATGGLSVGYDITKAWVELGYSLVTGEGEKGPEREYDVGATEGEEGIFGGGAKYFEQLEKGMLSSGMAPMANALAEMSIVDSLLSGGLLTQHVLVAKAIKGATGYDVQSLLAMPDSDLVTLGNRAMTNAKVMANYAGYLEDDISDERRAEYGAILDDLAAKQYDIDKNILRLQQRTRPADWGESAGEALVLDSMSAVTSQVASLTGMGTCAAIGAVIGISGGPGGVALGAKIGGLGGGFVTTFLLERGASWPEMRDMVDDGGNKVDFETAYAWNTITAAVKALIETGADAFVVTRALGPAGDFMMRNEVRAATKAAMAHRGTRSAVKDMGKRWLSAATAEGAEEGAQAGVDILGKWAMTGITPDYDDSIAEMVRAGIIGAIGGGFVSGAMVPFHIAHQASEWHKVKRSTALATGVSQLAQVDGVRQLPAEFAEMLTELAKNNDRPIEGVFLSPERLQEVVNEQGADLNEIVTKLFGAKGMETFNAALADAKLKPEGATRATLRVDLETFVKEWAPLNLFEGFAGDITTASNTLTLREHATSQRAQVARIQETLKEIEAADKAAGGWVPATAAEIKLQRAVENQLRAAAKITGALDEDQVTETVRIHRSVARVLAARLDVPLEDMLMFSATQFGASLSNESPAQLERLLAEAQANVTQLEGLDSTDDTRAQLSAARDVLASVEQRQAAMENAEIITEAMDIDPLVESALDDDQLNMVERVSDAIISQHEPGPRLDAEAVTPVTKEQWQNFPQWETRVRAWMEYKGQHTKDEITRYITAMRGQFAIFSALSPFEMEFLPRTKQVVRSDWSSDLVKLFGKHDGDKVAMRAEVKAIEDKVERTRMVAELRKMGERYDVEWPEALNHIYSNANGNIEEMYLRVRDVVDNELRKTMFKALDDATSVETYNSIENRVNKKGEPVSREDASVTAWGALRENADAIYKLSFDLSAMCVKRLQAGATMAAIVEAVNKKRKALGKQPRGLRENEMLALANLFRLAGKEAPCLYCYVESPRQAVAGMVNDVLAIAAGDPSLIKDAAYKKRTPGRQTVWADSLIELAHAAMDEFKAKGIKATDLPSPLYWTNPESMKDKALQAEWVSFPALFAFAKKQVDNAKSNKPKEYSEYIGQLLKVDQSFIDYTAEHAGFRFFSSSDFQFEHVADLMQAFHDLALRKAHTHAYTKVLEYIEIFGDTNQKIQTSLFAHSAAVPRQADDGSWTVFKTDKEGRPTETALHTATSRDEALMFIDTYVPPDGFFQDTYQGMDWEVARKFREKHDHVGGVLIATSSAQIQWALDNDNIDFIIPFHASGMKVDLFAELGYVNFTATQDEKWAEPSRPGAEETAWSKWAKPEKEREGKKPKKVRMHELGAKDGITDEAMTKEYLRLCEERGLEPVFAKFMHHKKFAKLKKDYARSDTAFEPVKVFNEDGSDAINISKAADVLKQFMDFKKEVDADPTGVHTKLAVPAAIPDDPIKQTMIDLIGEYDLDDMDGDAKGPDPFMVTQTLLDNMPIPVAKKLARSVKKLAVEVVGPVQEQGPTKKAKDQTKTKAFKKWFGKSKVVDENGKPLRVYHGTNQLFDDFGAGQLGAATKSVSASGGFWLTSSSAVAGEYADNAAKTTITGAVKHAKRSEKFIRDIETARKRRDFDTEERLTVEFEAHELDAIREDAYGQSIMPVYLRMANPLVVDAEGRAHSTGQGAEIIERAKSEGHDGVVFKNTADSASHTVSDHFVVFDPEQIKSAIGNIGTFDPKSPSVVEQEGGSTPRGYMRHIQKAFKKTFQIFLKKGADISTPMHEMAHVYFEMLNDLANLPPPTIRSRELRGKTVYELVDNFTGKPVATFDNAAEAEVYAETYMPTLGSKVPPQIKHDLGAILSFIGAKSFKSATTAQHEKFARGFEKYMLEGTAPSVGLIATFGRIKAWLFKTYRDGKELGVEIDDNLRGVFDRMLATDDEISLMRASMGIDLPFFATAKQAGMTAAQFKAHNKKRDEVMNKSALLAHRLAAEATKDALSKTYRAEVAFNRDVARDDFRKRGDARAAQFIRKGVLVLEDGEVVQGPLQFAGKLNREAVQNLVGKNTRVYKSVRSGTAIEGHSPDDVATLFGFATGKEMLEAVAALPKESTYVREFAESLTLEDHPDLKAEIDRLDEIVGEALHNEGTTEALLREWMLINTKAGRGSMQQLAVERYARDQVSRMGIMELRPENALQRERKYAEISMAEAAKGDFNKAADAKLQQLIAHYSYREIMKAKEAREAGVKTVRKMSAKKTRERLGKAGATKAEPRSAYLDVSDSIVEGLGHPPFPRELSKLGVTDLVAKIDEDGGSVTFEPDVVREFIATPRKLNELSVAAFRDLVGVLKNIAANAGARNKVMLDNKKIDTEDAANMLIADAGENMATIGRLPSTEDSGNVLDFVLHQGREWSAELLRQSTIVNWLAGRDTTSAWHRLILRPMREGEKKVVNLTREIGKPIVDAFLAIPEKTRKRMREHIDGEKLFPHHAAGRLKPPQRRFELLMMALNTGTQDKENNTGNFERLTVGRGITEEQVIAALGELTLAEWQWVQSVWDANDKLWPEVRDLEMRDSGLAPARLPLRPFTIKTSDGHEFTSPGGYVPAVYDKRAAKNQNIVLGQGVSGMMDPSYSRPGTSRSHTKARAQNFSDVITLDPAVFQRGIAQTIQDLAFREPVRQVGALILHEEVHATVVSKIGPERTRALVDWVRAVGTNNSDIGQRKPPSALPMLRSNSMVAILGHRTMTASGDLANGFSAAPRLGKYWLPAFTRYHSDPAKWSAIVEEHSTWLTTARSTLDIEYDNLTKNLTRRQGKLAKAFNGYKDSAWWMFEQTFKLTAYPMWIGSYEMHMAEEGMSPEDAGYAADDFCAKYFPSNTNTEKSAIQRDKQLLGFSMMFFGYMNSLYQKNADALQELYTVWHMTKGHHKQKVWKTAKALPFVIGHLVAFHTLSSVLGEFFTGRGPDDEERDEGGVGWAKWYLRKLMMGFVGTVPYIGYPIESWLLGKEASIRGAPGVASFDQVLKALAQVSNARPNALETALKAVALLAGVPMSPLVQIEYLFDDDGLEQDVNERDPAGVVEGLFFGKRKPWSGLTPPGLLSK